MLLQPADMEELFGSLGFVTAAPGTVPHLGPGSVGLHITTIDLLVVLGFHRYAFDKSEISERVPRRTCTYIYILSGVDTHAELSSLEAEPELRRSNLRCMKETRERRFLVGETCAQDRRALSIDRSKTNSLECNVNRRTR